MLDLRTLWLTVPEDRYQATPAWRRAERTLYPLLTTLRGWNEYRTGSRAGAALPNCR
jgi:hypothetical protein